ncbi:MAG: hypothetical protein M1813_009704 [Trichoglossum hirsutum]|nr:MAG: hypothetical protein M1813_009704 [Trichoglossum hirsutum]
MTGWTQDQIVHFIGVILAWDGNGDYLEDKEAWLSAIRCEGGDGDWKSLSQESAFSGYGPEDIRGQANFLLEKLRELTADETPPQITHSTTPLRSFTRQQNCIIFCKAHGVPFLGLTPFPIPPTNLTTLLQELPQFSRALSDRDVEDMYVQFKKFLSVFLTTRMSFQELEVIRIVNEMRCLGEFCNDHRPLGIYTRWDKAAERLSELYPEWKPDASEVICIYLDWVDEYRYDYQEEEAQDAQGSGDREFDDSPTYKDIGLILAAIFKDPHLDRLLERNPATWRLAFHRADKYWKRLSRKDVLRGRTWESVKSQTISLLKKIEELSCNIIPFLDKYKMTQLQDFTYEQNMFLVKKALKLGILTPFPPSTPLGDLAEILSESKMFPYRIHLEDLAMLHMRIKSLVSLLEPLLPTSEVPALRTLDILQLKGDENLPYGFARAFDRLSHERGNRNTFTSDHEKSGIIVETAKLQAPVGRLKRNSEESLPIPQGKRIK